MSKPKKIDIVSTNKAMECGSTTRNRRVRDLSFFAFRVHSWFVFVEDLGEEAEKKEEQIPLF